jgi:hypothetical protein
VIAFQNDKDDTVLVLADLAGKRLWAKRFPHPAPNPQPEYLFRPGELLLDAPQSGHFAVVSGKERVEFAASAKDGKWGVTEVARTPYDPNARAREQLQAVPAITLEPGKTIQLQSKTPSLPKPAIHDVRHFIDAGPDRFAYIEGWISQGTNLVMVDTAGNILGSFDLKKLKDVGSDYIWLKDKTFLLGQNRSFGYVQAQFWQVDLASGKSALVTFPGVTWQMPLKIARFKNGAYALAGSTKFGDYFGDGLAIYDANRKLLSLQRLDKLVERGYISIEELIVDSKDRLVLIDDYGKRVLYVSPQGKVTKELPLSMPGARSYTSVSGVSADLDGSIILDISYGVGPKVPTMYRFSSDGKITPMFRPHRADGKTFMYLNAVRPDTKGNYWSSDEHSLVQLDSKGVVTKTLGAAVEPDVIADVADLEIGADLSIYVLDERSMTVHAFFPDGTQKYVFHTEGLDFPRGRSSGLVVNRDGSAFLGNSTKGEVMVGADGKLIGFRNAPVEEFPMHGTSLEAADGLRWTIDYGSSPILLSDTSGKVVKRIGKRSDGGLVGMARYLYSALDGSACVESKPSPEGGLGLYMGPSTICTFGPTGDPLGTFVMPRWGWARVRGFDGKRIYAGIDDALVCFDLNGQPLWRASASFVPERQHSLITKDGKYFVTGTAKEITFYPLPGT